MLDLGALVLAYALGGALLRAIVGAPPPGSGYLAAALAWHVWNLVRFERWLRLRSALAPPNLGGLWGSAVEVAYRLYQRKQFHKQRVRTLLRELRRMTSAMPDGAILLGSTREILWFNRTAGQWLGLRRKLDHGLRIDNLIRQPEFVQYVRSGGVGAASGAVACQSEGESGKGSAMAAFLVRSASARGAGSPGCAAPADWSAPRGRRPARR